MPRSKKNPPESQSRWEELPLFRNPGADSAPAPVEAGRTARATSPKRFSAAAPLELPDWSAVPPAPSGVRFGTSSWTYPGWTGQIYSRHYRATGDTVAMLEEYARCPLFGCAGVDSSFYRPPSIDTLRAYARVLPPGFEAVGKVWDRITIRKFGNDKRWGQDAGLPNPDFLNPALCTDQVVGPWLEGLGEHAGPLVFEFQTMYSPYRPPPEVWAAELVRFFEALPKAGRYSIELRNEELLHPAYFEALRSVGVAHVFNAWTRMPTVGEQLELPGSLTSDFVVARALLMKGRTYDESVDKFKPYDRIQEVQPEVRRDLVRLVRAALGRGMRVYILVNNRLEGNSPETIRALHEMLAGPEV